MPHLTILPQSVGYFLRGTRQFFRYRHHLVFCWTLVLILVCPGKATLCGLARLGPAHICEWHLRRFLYASYWCVRLVLWWFVDAVLAVLPPPEDGVVYAIVDKTVKVKTATHHPFTKKGRIRTNGPYLFGMQIVFLLLHWGNYRIPIDFELVRKTEAQGYRSPNALLRTMLCRFRRPAWATKVVVLADAEFPSKETLNLIKKRGYFFVMSLPRTWKFADDRALSDLVNHLPRIHYRTTWITRSDGHRRVYWVYLKHACLRHVGDVTIVLSKQRRNDGPKATIIIVTNLPHVTSRDVVALYTRRWTVELFIKEVKGVVGLGQAQVTKAPQRVERSVALSLMAYLLLIKFRAKDIPQHGPWSAFALKRHFAWEVAQQQLEHSFSLRLRKHRSMREAA